MKARRINLYDEPVILVVRTRRFFKSCAVLLEVVSTRFKCVVERCVADDVRENDEPDVVTAFVGKNDDDGRYILSNA